VWTFAPRFVELETREEERACAIDLKNRHVLAYIRKIDRGTVDQHVSNGLTAGFRLD
jgi:hypothetical protein